MKTIKFCLLRRARQERLTRFRQVRADREIDPSINIYGLEESDDTQRYWCSSWSRRSAQQWQALDMAKWPGTGNHIEIILR